MRSRAVRRLVAAAVVAVLAASVYLVGRLLAAKGLDWADKVSSVVSATLALLGLVASALFRLWGRAPKRRPVSEEDIARTGDDLAAALGRRWAGEERLHRVHDPRPLPIRWESADPAQPAVRGSYGHVLAFFTARPAHRVVFLGSAGAGKSVLVTKLARDLLEARGAGDPVPVIVPAGEWDPGLDLGRWLADELTRRYSGLAEEVSLVTGETGRLADLLVAGGRVVPILDGLDELPAALRADAVTQINDLGSDLPLVVTSRPEEYHDAVGRAGRGITAATVVALRPLRVQEAEDYLREATAASPDGRWDPVVARLDAEPDGPLAEALTTPLLLWLARTIYESGDADPAELADRSRFADRAAIEGHLLETFIPAVYAPRTLHGEEPRYTARQATRWLAFLAAHLQRTGTQEIAWWRLSSASHDGPVDALRFLALSVLGRLLLGRLVHGYGDSVPWRRILLGGPLGHRLRPTLDPVISWFAGLLGDDALTGLVTALVRLDVVTWLVILILTVGMVGAADEEPRTLAFTPRAAARQLRASAANTATLCGLCLVVYIVHWSPRRDQIDLWSPFTQGLVLALLVVAVRLPRRLVSRVSLTTESTNSTGEAVDPGLLGPREVLRLDRRSDLVTAVLGRLTFGAGVALVAVGRVAVGYAAFAAAATVLTALFGGGRRANGRYRDAHYGLLLNRRLPLRPLDFLADAHRRGVLRRTGPVYQFRHLRLQEHLAAGHPRRRTYARPVLDLVRRSTAPARSALAGRLRVVTRTAVARSGRHLLWIGRPVRAAERWLVESNERDDARRANSRAAWRRTAAWLGSGDTRPLTGHKDLDDLLDRLGRRLSARLGADLVALYLHGSLATEEFHPRHSDIDLLAVVRSHPDDPTRQLVDALLDALTGDTQVIDLEWVTVDELASAEPLASPRPGALLTFANAPLLLRHALRDRARAVLGPPPRTLVPEVPAADYRTAFRHHLDALSAIDWRTASDRDRSAAVRITCRGLQVSQTGRLRPLTPPWLSVPGVLRRHFRPVRAALLRRPTAEPETLIGILTAARGAVVEPTTTTGDRPDPKVRTQG